MSRHAHIHDRHDLMHQHRMSHHVKVCDWPKVPSSCWSEGREEEGRAATAFSSLSIGKGA